jgi:U4/U6 small nuclear ribonucleoprotein PRP3
MDEDDLRAKKRHKTSTDVLEKAKNALAMQARLKEKLESLKQTKAALAKNVGKHDARSTFELIHAPEGTSYGRRRSRALAFQFIDGESIRKPKQEEEEAAQTATPKALPRSASPPPSVEWWDAKILVDTSSYPDELSDECIRMDRLNAYVEHPVELDPVIKEIVPPPAPLKLTRREMKKLRTQRRQAREEEKQQLIRQGLLEPPKPKVKLSNLMRVLSADAAADPTAIEKKVAKEMAERHSAHVDRNLARMLSPAERRQKKMKKLLDVLPGETPTEVKVAVYKIQGSLSPQNRFKVQVNAFENHLTGVCLVGHTMAIVVVEGGPKTLRRYEHLMLRRISWSGDNDEDEGADCKLVWTGIVAERSFQGKFRTVDVENPREVLEERGVGHYFDLCAVSNE